MARQRREFRRPSPTRMYRTLYIIATEGSETEPAYFAMFQGRNATIKVKILDSRQKSAPGQVLRRAEQYIVTESLRKTDSVWLVLDRDTWGEPELKLVCQTCQAKGFHLVVSNPCFEYWLLLHFEKGSDVTTASICRDRLLQHQLCKKTRRNSEAAP